MSILDDLELDEAPAGGDGLEGLELDAADAPAPLPAADAPAPLMEILPADFPLPALVRFVPDPRYRQALEAVTGKAAGVVVKGGGLEAIQRADAVIGEAKDAIKAAVEHLKEPIELANRLHKGLTSTRAEWTKPAQDAADALGLAVWNERNRLDAIEREERRREQEQRDAEERARIRKAAEEAAARKAPAAEVENLERQAETATAAPVTRTAPAPSSVMTRTAVVDVWRCRLKGTPADAEANPAIADMSAGQIERVKRLLSHIVAGTAPLAAISIEWGYLNKRAAAEESTLAIPEIEPFKTGGVRGRGGRRKA